MRIRVYLYAAVILLLGVLATTGSVLQEEDAKDVTSLMEVDAEEEMQSLRRQKKERKKGRKEGRKRKEKKKKERY